jgi:8-oxo-dGTP pyrophosphatase MutT (NUDIX family)
VIFVTPASFRERDLPLPALCVVRHDRTSAHRRRASQRPRAVIIHEGRLLTVKMCDRSGVFYILPGGGQVAARPIAVTLRRECMEEIGVDVTVHELL